MTDDLPPVLALRPRGGIEPPNEERLLTLAELAARLRVSRSKVERDVVAGLPAIDVGRHHPGRRRKRTLRFKWIAVLSWYEGRGVDK